MATSTKQIPYSVNEPGELPRGFAAPDGRSWGQASGVDYDRIPNARFTPRLDNSRPGDIDAQSILTNLSHQPEASYRIWIYPTHCIQYRPGGVFYGADTYCRRANHPPMELGATRCQLVGTPYRALVSFGFWANSFAARWLSNPWDSPPTG